MAAVKIQPAVRAVQLSGEIQPGRDHAAIRAHGAVFVPQPKHIRAVFARGAARQQRARDGRFDNQRPGQAVDRHREERREEAACQRRDKRLHVEFIHQQRHPLNQQPDEERRHQVPRAAAEHQ